MAFLELKELSSPLIPSLICITRGEKKIFVKKVKVKALQL